jgi:hypothetical protein
MSAAMSAAMSADSVAQAARRSRLLAVEVLTSSSVRDKLRPIKETNVSELFQMRLGAPLERGE